MTYLAVSLFVCSLAQEFNFYPRAYYILTILEAACTTYDHELTEPSGCYSISKKALHGAASELLTNCFGLNEF